MSIDVPPPPPRSLLCLGGAWLDLIHEAHVDGPTDATDYRPHFGGGAAGVALAVARSGTKVTLAGGTGADDWGRRLSETLHEAGVDTFRFRMIHGSQTPLALITVGSDGEASATSYGESADTVVEALGADSAQAVAEHGALFITSSTLVSASERAVTMSAREAALELDRPIVFQPNLRLERWSTRADAAASANACIQGAALLTVTAEEARLITGEQDIERAATALRKTGAANVVVSLGADGAILRGRIRADAPGAPVERICSNLGAMEALTASLITRLVGSDFYEPVLAAGLREAVRAAAVACEHWGAVD